MIISLTVTPSSKGEYALLLDSNGSITAGEDLLFPNQNLYSFGGGRLFYKRLTLYFAQKLYLTNSLFIIDFLNVLNYLSFND